MVTADGSLKGGTDSKLDMQDRRPQRSPQEMGPGAAGRGGGRASTHVLWCLVDLSCLHAAHPRLNCRRAGVGAAPYTHGQKHGPGFKLPPAWPWAGF